MSGKQALRGRERMRTGDVGIFWFLDGNLIRDGISWTKGEEYGEFINGTKDHYECWESLRRKQSRVRRLEYDEVPRGRVVYSKGDKKFYIYGSEQFVKNKEEKKMVLKAFSIAASEAVFRFDENYSMEANNTSEDSCDEL
jgi:hypothetical protein